jgi:hypothetical protein
MKRTVAVTVAFALVFVSGMGMAGWALYERFEQTNERREQQAAFNAQITRISLENCREIELLKQARREAAIEAYRDRHRTFALLGVEVTAELERAAKANRDTTLARYRRQPCPRPTGGQ